MTHLTNDEKPIGVIKITKKRSLFVVSFDNDETIDLTLEQLVEYRISLDKRFTEKELEKIKKESKLNIWYQKAIVHISYKLRTEKEMYDYLSKSDLEDREKKDIIKKLKNINYLNDLEYAKHYKEDCLSKKRGKRYFSNHLVKLGVSKEIINKVLEEFDEEKILDDLIIEYQKIETTLIKYPIIIQKQKLQDKMARKGISYNTITKVIENLEFKEDLTMSFLKDLEKIQNKTNDYNKQVSYLLSKGYNYQLIKEHLLK